MRASSNPARGIVGNTLHGFEDDGEFYDYYAPGGTTTSMLIGGETTHGVWSVKDGHLCISYPNDNPECFQVEVSGNTASLTDVENGNVFPVQIIKGNPKGL